VSSYYIYKYKVVSTLAVCTISLTWLIPTLQAISARFCLDQEKIYQLSHGKDNSKSWYLWLCTSANISTWYTAYYVCVLFFCIFSMLLFLWQKNSFLASFTKYSGIVLVVQNEYHSLKIATSYRYSNAQMSW